MGALAAGDPQAPGTICGPVISARQRDRIEGYLRIAADEGGTFATGGGRPADQERGFFIEPTLITGLDNSSRAGPGGDLRAGARGHPPRRRRRRRAHRQRLAPTASRAPCTRRDPDRAWAVAQRIRTGTLSINGGIWYSADMPFGGYKASGIGREMGVAGFEEYLETKAIALPA